MPPPSTAQQAAESSGLFVTDGERLVPTELARGPWTPDALHGGPVAALLVGAVEALGSDEPMHVVRLTVELLRPVPLVPLMTSARVVRPGRKVQLLEAALSDGERDLARVRALRLRLQAGEAAAELGAVQAGQDAAAPAPPAGPEEGRPSPPPIGPHRAFHNAGAELRYVAGAFDATGPATVWVRLAVPVVAGRETSPLQRVAAAADFGNGVSAVLDFARYQFINPDLTVTVLRPAVGEWVCLDATTRVGVPGVGVAESVLYDTTGRLGRSVQSLLVEPR